MNVDHRQVALARSGHKTLKDEFAGPGDIQQSQVLGRRSDEDQIVILGVIEREEGAALDPKGTIEQIEDAVELMDSQHFSDASVMVEDECAAYRRRG